MSYGTETDSGGVARLGCSQVRCVTALPQPLHSFVVGSDGYVYEGRGWHWVGAHTRGHNSRGFGVAFVGNYTGSLPSDAALKTVRDVLPSCAIRSGHLLPDYKVLGHRQLVHSDCPGNALFNLLRTWPHFTEVSLPVTAHGIVCPVCSEHTSSAPALPQSACLLLDCQPLCWHPSDL